AASQRLVDGGVDLRKRNHLGLGLEFVELFLRLLQAIGNLLFLRGDELEGADRPVDIEVLLKITGEQRLQHLDRELRVVIAVRDRDHVAALVRRHEQAVTNFGGGTRQTVACGEAENTLGADRLGDFAGEIPALEKLEDRKSTRLNSSHVK